MRKGLIIGAALVVILVVAAVGYSLMPHGEFVGSRYSDKYHETSCTWAKSMSKDNRVWFSDAAEAEAAGYVPCPECQPEVGE